MFPSNQVGAPPEPLIHDKHLRQRKRQLKAAKQCRIPARELGTSDLWISYCMFSSFFELICDSWLKSFVLGFIYLNFLKSWVCGLKGGDYPPVFSQAGQMGIFFFFFFFLFFFPATQTDLRPSTGSATVSTKAAAAQALLAQHLGCPTRPPQTAASLLAQPDVFSSSCSSSYLFSCFNHHRCTTKWPQWLTCPRYLHSNPT